MKNIKKIIASFLLASSLLVAATPVSAQSSLEEIKEKGEIVMGTSADFPPFEWVVIEDSEAKEIGIDIDLAHLIAEKIGVELVIEDTSFDALIASVSSGRVDMVLAGMTYSEERAEQVDFSDIYYETMSMFVVPIGEEENYSTLEDFSDLRIGVQKGTIQEGLVKELLPEAEVVSMNKNGDIIEALKAKRIDAVLMDGVVVNEFVNLNSDIIVLLDDVQVEEETEGFAVVTAKENSELMEIINEVIKEAIESGQMQDIFEKNIELNAQTVEE